MELHGSLANNLTSAVQSARRLRGHPVHADTIRHWTDLLHHARRALSGGSGEPIHALIIELEKEQRTERLNVSFRPLPAIS
jgi:hypothetical protein